MYASAFFFFFFVQSGQQFSAISNIEPVEIFCQGWFGDSCEDSSSQEDVG